MQIWLKRWILDLFTATAQQSGIRAAERKLNRVLVSNFPLSTSKTAAR